MGATQDAHPTQSFFQGVALDFWRKSVTKQQTLAEVDFLEQALNASKGMRILDVPCGNGRHSIELAGRGYRMTGLDSSSEFIAEARACATERNLQVEWHLGDMQQIPWSAQFDGAFCFGNSFGYSDARGMETFLGGLARALKPTARFVLDTGMAAESFLPHIETKFWVRMDDLILLIENHYEVGESRLDTRFTFLRNGKSETRAFSHWVYTVGEIRRMLGHAGFATVDLYGSLAKEPYQVGGRILYLVAERR
jgi:SAM-dependent methyltransferase